MHPRDRIRDKALELGFNAVGFAPAQTAAAARAHLADFVRRGLPGDMGWMGETPARRADPQVLWPQARSAIVVGLNYGPAEDPMAGLQHRDRGLISVYARGRD